MYIEVVYGVMTFGCTDTKHVNVELFGCCVCYEKAYVL